MHVCHGSCVWVTGQLWVLVLVFHIVGQRSSNWLVNSRGFSCPHLLSPHRSNVVPDSFCMSSFYMGPRDLNLGSHACTADTFTHWTISSVPWFILNLADAFVKVTSSTIRDFYKGWKCTSTYQESSQRALDIWVLKNVCLAEERKKKRCFQKASKHIRGWHLHTDNWRALIKNNSHLVFNTGNLVTRSSTHNQWITQGEGPGTGVFWRWWARDCCLHRVRTGGRGGDGGSGKWELSVKCLGSQAARKQLPFP